MEKFSEDYNNDGKKHYTITLNIESESDDGFENALDEATKNIKAGNVSGMDKNDEESYNFTVVKS
jgi:hypothetical protein